MKFILPVTNWFLRLVFRTVCRIDQAEIEKIPTEGPLILVGNHVNFLEAPIMLPHMDNPNVTGLAKRETWNNPFLRFLFSSWDFIPIDRGMVDREAFRRSIEALKQKKILAVSPEGTRSKDGCLLPGKPGVVILALRSRAPLVPIGFYGHENFWNNLLHLRRTEFHIVVGKPFQLMIEGENPNQAVRQAMTDEIMYKISELLPERYRGVYQFKDRVEYKYVVAA